MEGKIPIYYTQWGKERDCEHLRYFCMARSLPLPAVFSASTEFPPQASLMSSPAFWLKYDPVFFCIGSPYPLLPWNWLFIDAFFFCPLVFLGLSIPANPVTPLASSSYAFLVLSFSTSSSLGWYFSMLFSSFLVFLASLLIIFSCTFLSYPHINIMC